MRFENPQQVKDWADKAAKSDYARHVVIHTDPDGTCWQVSLNPYCTQGARDSWQRGFDNKPARAWENLEFDYQYQRGAAAARIINKTRAGDI